MANMVNMVNTAANILGNIPPSGNDQPLLLASATGTTKILCAVGVPNRPDLGKMELVFRDDPRMFYAKDSRGVPYKLNAQTTDEAKQEIRNKLGGKGYRYAFDLPVPPGSLTPVVMDFSGIGNSGRPSNPFLPKQNLKPYQITDGMGTSSYLPVPSSQPQNLFPSNPSYAPLSPEIKAVVEAGMRKAVNGWFTRLQSAHAQFLRDPSAPNARQQFGNELAAIRRNLKETGWRPDQLTPAQAESLKKAGYDYAPIGRAKTQTFRTTLTGQNGQKIYVRAEVLLHESLTYDGMTRHVTKAEITRLYYDDMSDNGREHDKILKPPVDVSQGIGRYGHGLGEPLRTIPAVMEVVGDRVRSRFFHMWNQDAPKDAKGRFVPPRVFTMSETTGAMITGFGRVGIDFLTGFAQLALVPLAGLGELMNVFASPFTGDDVLIPAAYQYASEFQEGLRDLSKFVAEHGSEIPGLALTGFQQELKNIDQMMANGNLLGAIEKITYLTTSLVAAVAGVKSLPKNAAGLVGKLKTGMATAENIVGQLRKLPTEKLNLLKGPNFRLGGKTGELLVPKSSSNVRNSAPTPSNNIPIALPIRPTLPSKLKESQNNVKPLDKPFTPVKPAKPENPGTSGAGVSPKSDPTGPGSLNSSTGSKQPQPVGSDTLVPSSLNPLTPKTKSNAPTATLEPVPARNSGTPSTPPTPSEGNAAKQGTGNPSSSSPSPGDSTGGGSSGAGGANKPPPLTPSSSAGDMNNDPEAAIKRMLAQRQNPRIGIQIRMSDGELRFTQSPEMIRRWINRGGAFTGKIGTRDMLPEVLPRPVTGTNPSASPGSQSGGSTGSSQVNRPSAAPPGAGGANVPPSAKSSALPADGANDPSVIYDQLKQQRTQTGNPDLVAWFDVNGELKSARGILPIETLVDQHGARFLGISSRDNPPKIAVANNLGKQATPGTQTPAHDENIVDRLNRLIDPKDTADPGNRPDGKLADSIAQNPNVIKDLERLRLTEENYAREESVIAAAQQALGPNSTGGARPYDPFELFDVSNRFSTERADSTMLKFKFLAKGQEFVDIRDGTYTVPGRSEPFRFIEYKKGVTPTPILNPNNIVKTNDYVVNGKRVAWYDIKEKVIMVDSEALFNLGMSTSTIEPETRNPVLNALWNTLKKTGDATLTEPSTPQRSVRIVLNTSVGKSSYSVIPEHQNKKLKELMGVPSGEPLLSRQLNMNGLDSKAPYECFNPTKDELDILPRDKAKAEQFIATRRSWSRLVMNLGQHGGLNPEEIVRLLGRDGIPTLGGDMNVARASTIMNMTGSGILPKIEGKMLTGAKHVNIAVIPPDIFRKGLYDPTNFVGRWPAVQPVLDKATIIQTRRAWRLEIAGKGLGIGALVGTTVGLVLNYVTSREKLGLDAHLNSAPEELLYGLPVKLSLSELKDLQAQIKQASVENDGSEKLGASLFKPRADGTLMLKGTMDLRSEFNNAIRQYGKLQNQVTELSTLVVASGRNDGAETAAMNNLAAQAGAALDKAETALAANELLLKLWATGITVQGEKVLGLDQKKMPTYFSGYLSEIEVSRKQIEGFRLALKDGTAAASKDALNLGNVKENQKISSDSNVQRAEQAEKSRAQAKDSLDETTANNQRTTSQAQFNNWKTTVVEQYNNSALDLYGVSKGLAPGVSIAGTKIVLPSPLSPQNEVRTKEMRLNIFKGIINSIPESARLFIELSGSTLEAQKALALEEASKLLDRYPGDPSKPQTNSNNPQSNGSQITMPDL
jgi:hypothetical protein